MILSSLLRLLIALCVLPASVWGWSPVPIGLVARTVPRELRGSCVDLGIERDIEDAKALVDHAIGVIEPLISRTVQKDSDWINRFDMAMAMFGIEYVTLPPKTHGGQERLKLSYGAGYLQQALSRYKEVQSRLHNGPGPHNSPFMLQCGDRDLKWATILGDLGYTKKDRPDQTPLMSKIGGSSLRGHSGLFFSRNWSTTKDIGKAKDKSRIYAYDYKKAIFLVGGGGSGRGSFCESLGDDASYQMDAVRDNFGDSYSSLVLCNSYFGFKFLADAMAIQHRVGQDLDKLTTRGGVLLHELMHITTRNIITDQLIRWGGQNRKAYEFEICYALAQAEKGKSPEVNKALLNADAYRIFAEGIHAIEVNWVRSDC